MDVIDPQNALIIEQNEEIIDLLTKLIALAESVTMTNVHKEGIVRVNV